MKEIKAIIQPFLLDNVLRALETLTELPGLTVSQVHGWGKAHGETLEDPVHEAGHSFAKKTKLEIVVSDDLASQVVQVIATAARTGRAGDGKVFVYEVAEVVRIRTGERSAEVP